jgi:hypothetical protein
MLDFWNDHHLDFLTKNKINHVDTTDKFLTAGDGPWRFLLSAKTLKYAEKLEKPMVINGHLTGHLNFLSDRILHPRVQFICI